MTLSLSAARSACAPTKPRLSALAVGVAFLGLAAGTTRAQTPGYHFPGQTDQSEGSYGTALSADGRVLAGYSLGGTAGNPGFVWSEAGGRFDFGLGEFQGRITRSAAISGDGTTVAGQTLGLDAFRWSGPGTLQRLGYLPPSATQPPHDRSEGRGVSGDGSIVVGTSSKTQSIYGQAFRWTQATGMQGIGFTFPDHVYSEANAISRDGNVIVGMSQSALGRTDAFRWTAEGGMQHLAPLSGSISDSGYAYGTNFDGSMIVGMSQVTSGSGRLTATLWSGSTIQALTAPAGWDSQATDISDDGSVVLGSFSNFNQVFVPQIWTPTSGWQTPGVYFAGMGFPLPTEWNVNTLTSLSADGNTFAGTYVSGTTSKAFVLTVPTSGTLALLGCAALATTRRRRKIAVAVGLLAIASPALAQTPGYHLPGFAPSGTSSNAAALSADGRIAAGFSQGGTVGQPGFIWSEASGRTDFGLENVVSRFSPSAAISGDGATVVGKVANTEAYVWRGAGTFHSLGFLPPSATQPPHDRSSARGVSGDGSIIVGESHRELSPFGQAFRWTQAGGMQPLGFTRPDDLYSEANDISRDGNVIVGASRSPDGVDNAFAWTPTAGMRILPALPGSPLGIADAHGTNFDGSIIVGDSEDQTARRTATMWVNNTAMSLGVPEGWYRSRALEVNEAGDVVLGTLNSQAVVSTPAVWSSGSGWQLPGDYFAAQGFPLPTGWNVTSLNDISADGRTFAGSYNLGSGLSEAFVLTIPAPGAAMLLGAMSIPLLQRRRRPEETLSGGPTEAIPKNIPASAAKRNSLPLKPLQWRAQRHLIE